MHVGIHICRGNFTDSRYWSAGGYDAIAIQLFRELNVNTFYLEFDTSRAGGLEPLQFLPVGKNVILGVVSTKSAEIENIEELKERVLKAASFIAEGNGISLEESLQMLGVSPQCGFASNSREDRLTKENMLDTLNLVRELATAIWPGEA
jgi:methionine synthase II (cobalamin-independent)